MFHTDDEMYASKPVALLPAQYQLEALGLWQKCGQWSVNQNTEGIVLMSKIHELSPLSVRRTNTLIGLLCDVAVTDDGDGLWERVEWRGQPAIEYRDWDVWQDTREKIKRRRDSWRESKRRTRAGENLDETRAKLGRNSDESQTKLAPNSDETQPLKRSDQRNGENVHSGHPVDVHAVSTGSLFHIPNTNYSPKQLAHVSDARDEQPTPPPRNRTFTDMAGGREPPPPPDPGPDGQRAQRVVRDIIPTSYPPTERGKLVLQAERLLADGCEYQLVADALGLWLTKPHLGTAALPSLVSEVLKLRDARPNSRSPSSKAQATLDATARILEHYPDQPEIEARK